MEGMTVYLNIVFQRCEDAGCGVGCFEPIVHRWCHHRKLISPIPGNHRLGKGRRDPCCDLTQYGVADLVAEAVVDEIEVVEIEEEQGAGQLAGCREVIEVLHETGASEKAGQRIVSHGKQPQLVGPPALLLSRNLGGDVAGYGNHADDRTRVIAHRGVECEIRAAVELRPGRRLQSGERLFKCEQSPRIGRDLRNVLADIVFEAYARELALPGCEGQA